MKDKYKTSNRISWNEYFFNIAEAVSLRSSCLRNKVGAVIVKDNTVISTGYNGAPTYQENCFSKNNCYRNENRIKSGTQLELCRAVGSHAESNAINLAAKNGSSINKATIYIVGHDFICNQCKAQLANAGIQHILLKNTKGEIEHYNPLVDFRVHPID